MEMNYLLISSSLLRFVSSGSIILFLVADCCKLVIIANNNKLSKYLDPVHITEIRNIIILFNKKLVSITITFGVLRITEQQR